MKSSYQYSLSACKLHLILFSLFSLGWAEENNTAASWQTVSICSYQKDLINCSRKGMKEFKFLPRWIEKLDLSHNRLTSIDGTFRGLSELKSLDLSNNLISYLSTTTFNETVNLKRLKLVGNRISALTKDLFRNLEYLTYLDLSKNRIKKIDALTFNGLKSLEVLKIKKNRIVELVDAAFWPLSSLKTLALDFNEIGSLKRTWTFQLYNLRHLNLSFNKIFEIEDSALSKSAKLQDLDLSHNLLITLSKKAFNSLSNLKTLSLSYNLLNFIEDGCFKSTPLLSYLDLSFNNLASMIENSTELFTHLGELTFLNLFGNRIKMIPNMTFVGLNKLKYLDIRKNPITTIESNPFNSLKSIKEIKLNTSSFVCDCNVNWLYNLTKIRSNYIYFFDSVTCIYPREFINMSFIHLNYEDLKCLENPKPILIELTQSQKISKGSNISLTCRVISSVSSHLSFKWRKNGKFIFSFKTLAQTINNSHIEYISIFDLYNVKDESSGQYQCIASNAYGVVYSPWITVEIDAKALPYLNKRPSNINVTYREGGFGSFKCSAAPEIIWDASDSFSASKDGSDVVFYIINPHLIDSGMNSNLVYSCRAIDYVDETNWDVNSTIMKAPTFTKQMENKEVHANDSALLECFCSGNPKPVIDWTKDGIPLDISDRRIIADDGQILIIKQAQTYDSGQYYCEISNELGRIGDFSNLVILPEVKDEDITYNELEQLNAWSENLTWWLVVIAVICCIVITSSVWILIIYVTKKTEENDYSTGDDSFAVILEPKEEISNSIKSKSEKKSDNSILIQNDLIQEKKEKQRYSLNLSSKVSLTTLIHGSSVESIPR